MYREGVHWVLVAEDMFQWQSDERPEVYVMNIEENFQVYLNKTLFNPNFPAQYCEVLRSCCSSVVYATGLNGTGFESR
jgi:hypothetical protein